MIPTLGVHKRKCGFPKEGGVYILGGALVSEQGSTQRFVRIVPPIPYPVSVHRGPRIVNDMAILCRLPISEWWKGGSAETEQKKRGDTWALSVFGMPVSERKKLGECEGLVDSDTCVAQLVSKITIDDGIIDQFRRLSQYQVGNFPRVAVHYDSFRTALKETFEDGTIAGLMNLQASVWRLAHHIPPKKQPDIIPILCRVLILMNLPQDAIAMRNTFMQKGRDE